MAGWSSTCGPRLGRRAVERRAAPWPRVRSRVGPCPSPSAVAFGFAAWVRPPPRARGRDRGPQLCALGRPVTEARRSHAVLMKRRRKRCRSCEELFHPDARVGPRQQFCSASVCQRARRRTYQKKWRSAHPSDDRGRRLRQQLQRVEAGDPVPPPKPSEPLSYVPWDEVDSELGAGNRVVVAYVLGVVVRWLVQSGRSPSRALSDEPARSAEMPSTG